ncbi:energy-coupling factor ABC transporter ATP-binding protein [Bifidobacterium aerophilum]|uniref:ATP-binding cassette domain-containing protein n=1 Tax=Bifidobacterium aerophilum TaxID=1798155 RepID=A0A6N9Z2L6_9BIFI|nr:ABC transporter ATP-binding protein [Bifidobacterium aerophilum]NEG88564.1 ATP-binding cassette domain-containing protein [Bifidobacterium aerophilum]
MTSISLKHVSYRYPLDTNNVIDDMSFDIEQGRTYALIGANDSGKTTVCNIIRGFIPRFYRGDLTGSVEIDGKPVTDFDDAQLTTMIGYSFQNPFTQMSGVKDNVREEIAYALENLGVPRDEMIERVDAMIELLHLEALADKNPFELSGGQKQRVALAAVLVTDPGIVILDEPTSQLDPKGTEDIFDIVELLKSQGKTVILVEHKIDLIARYCDQVLLLDGGRLVMNGPVHEVLTDPAVLDHGGQLPQVARYYLERNRRFGRHDPIPLTVEEAAAQERKGR